MFSTDALVATCWPLAPLKEAAELPQVTPVAVAVSPLPE